MAILRASLSFISFGLRLRPRAVPPLLAAFALLAFGVIAAIGLVFHVGPFS